MIRNLALAATIALTLGVAPSTSLAATRYKNCTQLHKQYPHGVGRPGATDHSSGAPVTTFKVDKSVYQANQGSDRDGDGIACEQA